MEKITGGKHWRKAQKKSTKEKYWRKALEESTGEKYRRKALGKTSGKAGKANITLVRFPNCHKCPVASGLGNLTRGDQEERHLAMIMTMMTMLMMLLREQEVIKKRGIWHQEAEVPGTILSPLTLVVAAIVFISHWSCRRLFLSQGGRRGFAVVHMVASRC